MVKPRNLNCASASGSCLIGARSMSSPTGENIETPLPKQRSEGVTFLMTQLPEQQQQQMQQLQQQQNALVAQVPPMGQVDIFNKLARLKPPTFEGTCDLIVLESWIQNMEKLLEALDCPEERKVGITTYYLRGEAGCWWTTMKDNLLANEDFNWKRLKGELRGQFYLESVRSRKLEDFLYLRQRNMTPLELSKKFLELERFAPSLYCTESERAGRYIACLNSNIQEYLCGTIFGSFYEAVDRANDAYSVLIKEEKPQNCQKRKSRKGTSQDQSCKKRKCGLVNSKNQNLKKRSGYSKCRGCGNSLHKGFNCDGTPMVCYNCESPDHRANHCPKPSSQKRKSHKVTSQDQSCKKHKCGSADSKKRNLEKRSGNSKCRGCGNSLHQGFNCDGTPIVCYNCQSPDHRASHCPKPSSQKRKSNKGTSQDQSSKKHKSGPVDSKNQNTKKSKSSKCRRCDNPLHGGFKCDGTPLICYNCEGPGHMARSCPKHSS